VYLVRLAKFTGDGVMKFLATAIGVLIFSLSASGQQYDTLIRNGRVVDGSGNPWVHADVGIIGDRIAFVGQAAAGVTAKRTIDASGLVVAPGFIDMLGQSELNLLIDKQAVSKLTQGITTEITGEGDSIAPQNDNTIAEQKDFLQHYKLTIDWTNLDGYFSRLEKQGAGINLATYVGAAQVREVVIGRDNRPPTAQELKDMQDYVEDAMLQGAMGISSALIYSPGSYATTDELIALAKVAARYGGIYASHIRNESQGEPAALEEAFRIGREAHLPVEIFHFKIAGQANWGRIPEMIALIEKARAEGVDVTADMYPYVASATSLGAVVPHPYHAGGADAFVARLKDAAIRAKIRQELEAPAQGDMENMWLGPGGPQGILVVSVLNPELKKYEGKTVAQIAQAENKDPFEAMLDFVIADHDNTGAVYFEMREDDVKLGLQQPWVSIDNDYGEISPTGPLGESKSHPRAYGSFPRILGKYVREEHALRLEDAIRKFSSLPAQREGLIDRGLLRAGYFADITIFDPDKIKDVATFEDPNRPSVGIEYVLVNGVLSLQHGQVTGETGGRPLRGPGYAARAFAPEGLGPRGKIEGVITDEQGYPVPRAKVNLLDKSRKELASMTTKKDGRYELALEQPCLGCQVSVERAGFAGAARAVDYNGTNSLWFSFALTKSRGRKLPPNHAAAESPKK
jgi:dihydroorotase/N-acyl-D-amino-acid deacylase